MAMKLSHENAINKRKSLKSASDPSDKEKVYKRKNEKNSKKQKKHASSISFNDGRIWDFRWMQKVNISVVYRYFLKITLNFFYAYLTAAFFICVILLRAGEENYNYGGGIERETELNYYDTLGVSVSATQEEIKKAYRKLTLIWHPDRNQNCEACSTRFEEISTAYKTLGDEEKRKVYDSTYGGIMEKIHSSTASLHSKNIHSLIYDSNDIWILQIYSDLENLCHVFAPIWEESAEILGNYIKFGRINVITDKDALKYIPVNAKMYPAILVITRNYYSEVYNKILNPEVDHFNEFIISNIPDIVSPLQDEGDVDDFLSLTTNIQMPKLLILHLGRRYVAAPVAIKSLAYKWSSVFDIGIVRKRDGGRVLKESNISKEDSGVQLVLYMLDVNKEQYIFVAKETISSLDDIEEASNALYSIKLHTAPYIHRWNADILCRSKIQRVFCLFIIEETPNESVAEILESLNKSRLRFSEEHTAIDVDDDIFHVQLVRVHLGRQWNVIFNDLLKWSVDYKECSYVPPSGFVKNFVKLYDHYLNSTKSFLLDIEGMRYSLPPLDYQLASPLRYSNNIYQKIDDDIIEFSALPNFCSSASAFSAKCLYNCSASILHKILIALQTAPIFKSTSELLGIY